jgi:hypothetical protein
MRFRNREEAAALLAQRLPQFRGAGDAVAGPNRRAFAQISCEKRLDVVPGAVEQVADLAASWFELHLAHGAPRALPTIA